MSNCKFYADCDYRKDMGCPERCTQYRGDTVFDVITESPEKLAEVIAAIVHGYWTGATITDSPAKWLEWLNQPDGGTRYE